MSCHKRKNDVPELLPRVYLEASFLKCYRFLNEPEQSYISILERITLSIKGIANPLVASYARAYLVRCAEQGEMKDGNVVESSQHEVSAF